MVVDEQIKELIGQLEKLGYLPFQINQLISDKAGTTQYDSISPAGQQALITGLKDHITFAAKCCKIK